MKIFFVFASLCFFNHSQAAEPTKKFRFRESIFRKKSQLWFFFMV